MPTPRTFVQGKRHGEAKQRKTATEHTNPNGSTLAIDTQKSYLAVLQRVPQLRRTTAIRPNSWNTSN